jgi:phospholipid/cholesterol/gamma-HCH transport system substrate-binding protein
MNKESGYQWMGMFVIIGWYFLLQQYILLEKEKNLFGSTFELTAKFNSVNGLDIGNNVRFSGINIGTVKK